MGSVHVKVTGDNRRLIKRLQMMAELDVKGINKSIAEGIRTSTMERFRLEKDPEGKKWKPSIPCTGGRRKNPDGNRKA